jgi:DNA excision repair protein ERCC-2
VACLRILNFNPVAIQSFSMTLTRDCICPVVVTRGTDQMPISTKFELRGDPGSSLQPAFFFFLLHIA